MPDPTPPAAPATSPAAAGTPPAATPPATPPAGTPPASPPATPPAGTPPATPPATPETKPGEPDPSKPTAKVVPEKYELKLPEKAVLDPKHVEKISAYAKAKGLSNEEAQEILTRDNELLAADRQALLEAHQTTVAKWSEDVKSDKELGGEVMARKVELAKRVVQRFGTEQFRQMVETTGYGNHPEVVRIFARIGEVMGEDQLVVPGSSAPAGPKKALEDKLYPTTAEK